MATGSLAPKTATSAPREIVAGGIMVASVVMLVGTSSSYVQVALDSISDAGGGTERALLTALLLNVALIIFGWRRYRELREEVVERTAAEARAHVLAARDSLTNFLNRRSLIETGRELIESSMASGRAAALIAIDLDHFKNVNDLHGHLVGDKLLRAVARTIETVLPKTALSARLGGDEFAAIFSFQVGEQDQVTAIAENLINRLSRPFDIDGVHAHISASMGIAQTDFDCTTIDDILRRADIAMYEAKKLGRGRFAWFGLSMETELRARNLVEDGLRRGIPAGEIVPYYEQQVDLTTGELHGFEVLARWEHPTDGIVSPSVFIPVAEETGLIADLSMSVMTQAFREARSWDANLTLSVNISPVQLKDPWLSEKILKLLTETGFPANRLEIEITETSLFENLELAKATIASLKNQGVRLSLDDFGTGYSSLAHLRALPFDRIKIDRSFVQSLNENPDSATIVDAITRLGESLSLPITAEGVEDAAIQARLQTMGNYKGQGWHLGKPRSVENLRRFLADRSAVADERDYAAAEQALAVLKRVSKAVR